MSCAEEIIQAAKNANIVLEDEEVSEILSVLNERLAKRVELAGADEELELFSLAKSIARQARINVAVQRKNRLLNAKAYSKIMTTINAFPDDPSRALSAIMVGDAKFSFLSSVDAQQQAIMTQYSGELVAALRNNDLEKIFKSNQLDELIYEALFDPDTFDATRAGGAEAKKIAEIVQKIQKKILKRKNRAGAVIGELKNYIVRQNHDPILLRAGAKTQAELQAAKSDWVAYMLEPGRLDEKTFENKPPTTDKGEPYSREDFLGDIWTNLVTGRHQKVDALRGDDGSIDPLTAFKGPTNLAKKLSQGRVLHFASGKMAFDYSKKYNRQSFSEAILSQITNDAQSIGLMEEFGTNPRAMFDRVLNDIQNQNKDRPTILDTIKTARLNNQFKELDGTARARGAGKPTFFNTDFAGISAAWRMLQNMALLGMSTISSFSDIATKATFINSRTDRGIFGSYARAFGDIFSALKTTKEKQELAYLLNVGIENFLGDVHARFGANDSGPGMMAKAHQIFFRANGMSWWNNAQKVGLARMMSADLANYSSRPFDEVPTRTRLNLERYGITADDWAILGQIEQKAVDGRNYLTPGAIDALDDSVVESLVLARANATLKRPRKKATPDMIARYKDELTTKLATYLTDAADTAIPTPGAKERAIMNLGTERGTVLGEAIRAIMQLKGFPITYVTKGLTSQYYAKQQAGQSGAFGIAQMMIGSTMMGYLSVSLKDILKGKEPLEVFSEDYYLNPELLTKAFVQGGGAGIYGDFLFGEYNRYGQSLTQSLLGPTFGSIDDFARIYSDIRTGELSNAGKNSLKFAIRNIPYQNLFYTKMAVDYLFIYGLTEKVNPGYIRRMEKRMERDLDQEFYLPPSQYAVRF
jgi:hypothetical protein